MDIGEIEGLYIPRISLEAFLDLDAETQERRWRAQSPKVLSSAVGGYDSFRDYLLTGWQKERPTCRNEYIGVTVVGGRPGIIRTSSPALEELHNYALGQGHIPFHYSLTPKVRDRGTFTLKFLPYVPARLQVSQE